jgi:ferredoxin
MAYIICEPCIGTKDTACVDVCPGRLHSSPEDEPEFAAAEMLYIHPDECIDCGACVPACPVEAIFCARRNAVASGRLSSDECGLLRLA